MYHWFLHEENVLLLADKSTFQAYQLTSKSVTKLCKFTLKVDGTSAGPIPPVQGKAAPFHHHQIVCLLTPRIWRAHALLGTLRVVSCAVFVMTRLCLRRCVRCMGV